jgi:hypothetical protein
MQKQEPLNRFLRKTPGARLEPADGAGTLCGVFVITGKNGLAEHVAPVRIGGCLEEIVPGA